MTIPQALTICGVAAMRQSDDAAAIIKLIAGHVERESTGGSNK
ncbi:hypothetical protein [Rhodopseudomonas sp. BR0M22]|nr:hypothetical protein [Rhodopseudomonas sp. BR0M22]